MRTAIAISLTIVAFVIQRPLEVQRTWNDYKRFVATLENVPKDNCGKSDIHIEMNLLWKQLHALYKKNTNGESEEDIVVPIEEYLDQEQIPFPDWFIVDLRRQWSRKNKSFRPSEPVQIQIGKLHVFDAVEVFNADGPHFSVGEDGTIEIPIEEIPRSFTFASSEDESLVAVVGVLSFISSSKITVYDKTGFVWSQRIFSEEIKGFRSGNQRIRCAIVFANGNIWIYSISSLGFRIEGFRTTGERCLLLDSRAFE